MLDDQSIRRTVIRLSRPHPSGDRVIERAAVVASGTNSSAILTWIADHGGRPEAPSPPRSAHGLHGSRGPDARGDARRPLRYLLPATALAEPDEASGRVDWA